MSRAHLDGARATLLCADLPWTSGSGEARSLDQTREAQSSPWMQRGGNRDAREGAMVMCNAQAGRGLLPTWRTRSFHLRPKEPALCPTLVLRCAILFFLFCPRFGVAFWNKAAMLTSARGVGCCTKGEWAFLGLKKKKAKKKKKARVSGEAQGMWLGADGSWSSPSSVIQPPAVVTVSLPNI